jgi:hypothetical protein
MSDKPSPEFSNDSPLSDSADDKLNRAPFADRIADVLRGLPNGAGLVVGIHGPWGDGKTTVLNLLKNNLADDEDTAVVEFNPWRFTDEPSMLAGFFRVLAAAIRAKLTTKGEDIAGWVEKIGSYAAVANDRFGKAAKIAGDVADVGLEELRTRLFDALAKANKRIVVLVDDIDRLDKHETHTLFRLIKACADFPNVCYVLAFDDVAVAKALGERYGTGDEASGRAFLEKIIQVPLKLPVAMTEDLRSLCFQQVDEAIKAADVELSKNEVNDFVSRFERGISIRLDTPRAAKRYANSLMFALPMLKGEVNTVDMLLLEAIRAFYPTVYNCIRENHEEFSGVESEHRARRQNGLRCATLLKPIVDAMPAEEQEALKSILVDLFPRLGGEYGRGVYGIDWLDKWAEQKRLCSPDYCPRFFSYAVSKADVRDSEIEQLIETAASGDEQAVTEALQSFFSTGKARRAIERLRQHEKAMDTAAAAPLCIALASLAKCLPNHPSLFSFSEPPGQAAILISHLIQRLPAGASRVALAKRVIVAADPLWFGEECIRWLHVTDDADKQERNTLTEDEVKEVSTTLISRIESRAAAGESLFNVDVRQEQTLLFEWWRNKGREPVQKHLSELFERDPRNISLFLQAMVPNSWGTGDLLPRVGDLDGNQLKNIKLIFDLDDLATLIRKHLPGDFDNAQEYPDREHSVEQRLAEQFMFVYNKWKKDGEPPDREDRKDAKPTGTESAENREVDGES